MISITQSTEGSLYQSFSTIKDEFEEHLCAINENTNEIAQNHEYMCELDNKLNKLGERLDHLSMFLKSMGYSAGSTRYEVRPLGGTEQRVFLALYTIEDKKGHVTYHDLGGALDMEPQVVAGYIAALFEKGIPIVKRYVNDIAYLHLDREFKRLQATERIVSVDKAQTQLVVN